MNIRQFKGKISDKLFRRISEELGVVLPPEVRVGSVVKIIGCKSSHGSDLYRIKQCLGEHKVVESVTYRHWGSRATSENDVILAMGYPLNNISWEMGYWELVKY